MNFKRIFITGGSGTVGQAIIRKAIREQWDSEITVFSRDAIKHHAMKKKYPKNVHCVTGDIMDYQTLQLAMAHHDLVIHAAAIKHIPECEYFPVNAYDVNVGGSMNVLQAVIENDIEVVVGISTDKACHPANVYGATKLMMERAFQYYAQIYPDWIFRVARYGNVIESSGSVVELWKDAHARGEPITMTEPGMTRFWLSPRQAADILIDSIDEMASGLIYVPRLKSLPLYKMAEFVLGTDKYESQIIPIRPGEKIHETLLTSEEAARADGYDHGFFIAPSTEENHRTPPWLPLESGSPPFLQKEEFDHILAEESL